MCYRIGKRTGNSFLYMNNDLRTFSDTGFEWKKLESARQVVEHNKDREMLFIEEFKKTTNTKTIISEAAVDREGWNDFTVSSLKNDINQIAATIRTLTALETKYSNIVAAEDKTAVDILHYLELAKLSASDTAKLSKALKDSRIRRRKAKDMLTVIREVNSVGFVEDLAKIEATLDSLSNRDYTPRQTPLKEILNYNFAGSQTVSA